MLDLLKNDKFKKIGSRFIDTSEPEPEDTSEYVIETVRATSRYQKITKDSIFHYYLATEGKATIVKINGVVCILDIVPAITLPVEKIVPFVRIYFNSSDANMDILEGSKIYLKPIFKQDTKLFDDLKDKVIVKNVEWEYRDGVSKSDDDLPIRFLITNVQPDLVHFETPKFAIFNRYAPINTRAVLAKLGLAHEPLPVVDKEHRVTVPFQVDQIDTEPAKTLIMFRDKNGKVVIITCKKNVEMATLRDLLAGWLIGDNIIRYSRTLAKIQTTDCIIYTNKKLPVTPPCEVRPLKYLDLIAAGERTENNPDSVFIRHNPFTDSYMLVQSSNVKLRSFRKC